MIRLNNLSNGRGREVKKRSTDDLGIVHKALRHDFGSPQFTPPDENVDVGTVFRKICEWRKDIWNPTKRFDVGNLHVASSAAESPPPITANGLFLKMGTAPSQTAHALIPLCQ